MLSPAPAKCLSLRTGRPSRGARAPASASPGILLAEDEASLAGGPRLLERLSAHERDTLLALGQRKTIERGQLVFYQGDPHRGIYLVESGLVRVFYAAPSAREITLAYWHPGNFVGGPEIFGGVHMWSAIAARHSVVLHLPGEALRRLILRMPALALGIIEGLIFKGKSYSTLAQILGTRSVTERLNQLLLHLVETYGVPDQGGVLIDTALRHEDLAHMVGATRQWVTISLKRLQDRGILRASKGRLVVTNPARLSDFRRR